MTKKNEHLSSEETFGGLVCAAMQRVGILQGAAGLLASLAWAEALRGPHPEVPEGEHGLFRKRVAKRAVFWQETTVMA